jgi:hypothetical protein
LDKGFAFLINEYQLVHFYVNVTSYQIIIIWRVRFPHYNNIALPVAKSLGFNTTNEERTGKWNISVVICDIDIPKRSNSLSGDFNFTKGTLGSIATLLAATLYQGHPDSSHKLWNIVSSERYILHMQVLLECCYI